MLDPEKIYDIADIIRPETFYVEKHRIIYKTMEELSGKKEPIDLVTVSTKLKEKSQLDQIGGMSYLTELVNMVPSASNAEHYASIVHKKYLMRKLISASEDICNLSYDESNDSEVVIDSAEKMIYEVAQSTSGKKFIALGDALGEAWTRWESLHNSPEGMRGVPTGFRELDNKLSGLQKSDLIILAARPSCGKTSLALDIARNAAIRHGKYVAIFSLEMATQQLVDRMVSAESRVDAWKLRTGKLNMDTEFSKLRDSLEPLSKAPIDYRTKNRLIS